VSRTSVVAVVVAYNRQELLRRCLDSLAEQTVALTGTVVVDNASTDSSREVASTHPLGAHVVLTLVNMLFVQSLVVADPLPEGKRHSKNTHDGQEVDYILEGVLELTIDGKVLVLRKGDCVYFDATIPHCMHALEGKSAKFLCVVN